MRFGQTIVFVVLALVLAAFIGGCDNFFTSGDAIASIKISPASRLAAVGQTVDFTASGTTVNGVNRDVTSSATWKSTQPNVATVADGGVATTVAAGTTTVTASEDSGQGTASLIVTSSQLQSINITPSSPSVLQTQGTQQFTAKGTFADGSTQDLTNLVQWTSSSTSVATINSAGLATLVATGQTTITATVTTSSGVVTGTTTMSVT